MQCGTPACIEYAKCSQKMQHSLLSQTQACMMRACLLGHSCGCTWHQEVIRLVTAILDCRPGQLPVQGLLPRGGRQGSGGGPLP